MSTPRTEKISRLLSLVLRHDPGKIGITLDPEGWVPVDALLTALNRHRHPVDREILDEVVATNDKQRFAFDPGRTRIRANQGHSVAIDLALEPSIPPEFLWHGTVEKFLPAIREEGLQKRQRQHVHLSADEKTATTVGQRRGKPVLLHIRAGEMTRAGHPFYRSENGVWLTEHVPTAFIEFPR